MESKNVKIGLFQYLNAPSKMLKTRRKLGQNNNLFSKLNPQRNRLGSECTHARAHVNNARCYAQ